MESTLPIIKDYKEYLSSAIVIILLSNKLFQCFADCIYLWFYQYGNRNNIFFLIDVNFFRKRFSSFTQSWTLDCFSFPKGKINNWSMQTSAFSPSYPTKSDRVPAKHAWVAKRSRNPRPLGKCSIFERWSMSDCTPFTSSLCIITGRVFNAMNQRSQEREICF